MEPKMGPGRAAVGTVAVSGRFPGANGRAEGRQGVRTLSGRFLGITAEGG